MTGRCLEIMKIAFSITTVAAGQVQTKNIALLFSRLRLTHRWVTCLFLYLMTAFSFMPAHANNTENPASFFKQAEQPNQDIYPFTSADKTHQFQALTKEIRCLVCQNQNIADSNAPLARDLRAKIYTLLQAGHSPEEIRAYLTGRYGDFILLKPRFNPITFALWIWPFLLGCLAISILRRVAK